MSSVGRQLPPTGGSIEQALEALLTTLAQRSVRYAIIGGLAVIQHGRVRTTEDIDILLSVPQIAMPALFDALSRRGFSIDQPRNQRELIDQGLTAIHFGEVQVDLLRPLLPAHVHVLDKAITASVLGKPASVCSAEGLLVMKMAAFRPQDQADIADILAGYGSALDLEFVRKELVSMFGAGHERLAQLESLVKSSENRT